MTAVLYDFLMLAALGLPVQGGPQGGGPAARPKGSPAAGLPLPLRLPGAPAPAAPNAAVGTFRLYEKQTSRELFAACDLNRDDKLSWFEARKTLANDLDRESFHRLLDRNRDGVVTFDEFDRYFRTTTELGGELRIRPRALARRPRELGRILRLPPELQRFFALLDRNEDERVDRSEWKAVAPLVDPKGELAFASLDRDLSGYLEIEELRPLLPKLTVLDKSLRKPAAPHLRPLPEHVRPADLDGDSLLDLNEFRRALARIDPALARHAERILRDADRDGDRRLSATELAAAHPTSRR